MALSDVPLTKYQKAILTDGPSHYWPLNETTGTTATDWAGTAIGVQKAYLQARSGIARSGAIRSNYVFPLYGLITIDGRNLTKYIEYGSLRVTLALNEEPDTAAFDVMLTDSVVQSACVVGVDVLIGLGGATENVLFGGRILTAQTTVRPGAAVPRLRSVLCADYLQVLDSEYLITYDWPPQSATVTIKDLIARFANKPSGLAISVAGVAAGLPNHQSFGVTNERFSTLLRRLVTMFPGGGGFYVDPFKVLHVWEGASEPGLQNPASLTLANPMLKQFAETQDGSQLRDAAIVEGVRTTAPMGIVPDPATDPAFLLSMPVQDASILDKITDTGVRREVRVGTQRLLARYAEGAWSSPAGTSQTTVMATDSGFPPGPGVNFLTVQSTDFLRGRNMPWIKVDEQYLKVLSYTAAGVTPATMQVPGTGWGAIIGAIKTGAVVTAIDSLGDIVTTGRYDAPGSLEKMRPQPIDAEVVMVVRTAETDHAVHEQIVQDGRFARANAGNRGVREWQDFRRPLVELAFETDDLNAKPGRLQVYNLPEPPEPGMDALAGEYMILSAELSWPVWGQPPRRTCHAAAVHAADVVDAWLVDRR